MPSSSGSCRRGLSPRIHDLRGECRGWPLVRAFQKGPEGTLAGPVWLSVYLVMAAELRIDPFGQEAECIREVMFCQFGVAAGRSRRGAKSGRHARCRSVSE